MKDRAIDVAAFLGGAAIAFCAITYALKRLWSATA